MSHRTHLFIMGGLFAVAAVLLFTGVGGVSIVAGGGVVWLLWLAGCMLMMFFMMRVMGGMGGGDSNEDEPDPPEGDPTVGELPGVDEPADRTGHRRGSGLGRRR